MGFAPAESPLYTILVVLDSPRGRYHGGEVAAPVFRRIAEQVLAYRNVPAIVQDKPPVAKASWTEPAVPSLPDVMSERDPTALLDLDPTLVAPDFLGKTVRNVMEESLGKDWAIHPIGSGIAYQQFPPPGTPLPEGQKIVIWFRVGAATEPRRTLPELPGNLPKATPLRSSPPALSAATAAG